MATRLSDVDPGHKALSQRSVQRHPPEPQGFLPPIQLLRHKACPAIESPGPSQSSLQLCILDLMVPRAQSSLHSGRSSKGRCPRSCHCQPLCLLMVHSPSMQALGKHLCLHEKHMSTRIGFFHRPWQLTFSVRSQGRMAFPISNAPQPWTMMHKTQTTAHCPNVRRNLGKAATHRQVLISADKQVIWVGPNSSGPQICQWLESLQ